MPSQGHNTASVAIPIPRSANSPVLARHAGKERVIEAHKTGAWQLVQLSEEHVDRVLEIQRLCYAPEYRDARQAYVDRIRLFPEGNVAIMVPVPNKSAASPSTPPSPTAPGALKKRKKETTVWEMAGYILAQPFYRGDTNDMSDVSALKNWLKQSKGRVKDEQDCIYTHEIAIDPAFRGLGLTAPLVAYVERLAVLNGFAWLSLVSLEDAQTFWQRNSYTLVQAIDYGGHTCYYMEKPAPINTPQLQ